MAGSLIGPDHASLRRNGQDRAAAGGADGAAWAVVSDGCGSGRYSEVGASLTVAAASSALAHCARARVPLGDIPYVVQSAVVRALRSTTVAVLGAAQDVGYPRSAAVAERDVARDAFIAEHLLATVVAAFVRDQRAVFVWCGDGAIGAQIEKRPRVLSLEGLTPRPNAPSYPAYGLADCAATASWSSLFVGLPSTPPVSAVLVSTDGVPVEHLEALLAADGSSHRWGGRGLTRWLGKLAYARELNDDAAVALAMRGMS